MFRIRDGVERSEQTRMETVSGYSSIDEVMEDQQEMPMIDDNKLPKRTGFVLDIKACVVRILQDPKHRRKVSLWKLLIVYR
jgi:hypothetical protein